MDNLTFVGVVTVNHDHKPHCDQRRRVQWVVASYRDSDGAEYRKAFYGHNHGERPSIPLSGSHDQLDAFARMQLRYMGIKP